MNNTETARGRELVDRYGAKNVYNTKQLQELFEVESFAMGIVVVKRKSDGKRGFLDFDHAPRFYYNFVES
jgi:hypothetical protein